ncbi:MAG: glutathione S-transferase N-terminal domain-containing protein [Pseudomonadota bacterium]
MKLLHAGPSPFVRKVMVLLEEAGKTAEIELIDGFGAPTAPNDNVIAANPIGKIPCLITDEGLPIYDSRVITRYLDTRYGLGLYPAGDAVWKTLTLEAHADGMLDAAVLCVYEVRCRNESDRSTDWVEAQRGKVARGLDALETHWLDHLDGPLDMGVVGVGCALGYLDFRAEMGGFPDWRVGRPGLTKWGNAFLQRASMAASAP